MTDRWVSQLFLMMAEPEDARLTGQTRNLERRLLGLNVTRSRKAIVTPTSWLVRMFKVFHEGSTPDLSPEPELHSVCPFAKEHLARHSELQERYAVRLEEASPVRCLPPNL